jgi:mannose-6-phosphate isomerase
VLAIRPGTEGYIRLGFQRSPGREHWKQIIQEQDIAAMDACFDRIPVAAGDVWIVPGGMPHAIGEGVLMVEVMEPSDLVVRCEFEREGAVVPPAARFMGRGLEFCLQIFDYTAYTPDEIRARSRLTPELLHAEPGWRFDRLVGSKLTSCFELYRVKADQEGMFANDGRCALVVQTHGAGVVTADETTAELQFGDSCFVAAGAAKLRFTPRVDGAEILLCRPARA